MISRLALTLLLAGSEYQPRTVKQPAGRYLGVKQVGADPSHYHSLELVIDAKGGAKLTWARRDQEAERERRVLTLTQLHVDEAGFSAVMEGGPPSVPAKLVGRFVTKFPPANAKGRVEKGILFEGDWFLQSSSGDDSL